MKGGDTVLLFSIDGAQLYKMKQSDCRIYIWVVLNLSPDKRYKLRYVLPGGCIQGPNHPKNIDSFLFPGLYHFAAIQNDGGLAVWDPANEHVFCSQLHLAFATADSIGMAQIANWVGHHREYACIICGLSGRHKPGGPHYYLALLQPDQHNSHPDVDLAQMSSHSVSRYLDGLVKVIQSPNPTQYAVEVMCTLVVQMYNKVALHKRRVPTHWRPPIDTANTHGNNPGHHGMTGVDSIAKSAQALFSNLYIHYKRTTPTVNATFPRSAPH
ncbi:hypothetical protein PTI98_006398 [Pleurotus ostreatus]|nr:hypothetical protein PTI98_006398 [Pleurotus ostreatus]